MTPHARRVRRTVTLLASVAASLLIVLLPAAYFTLGWAYLRGTLDAEAEATAAGVGRLVVANPDMWFYEQVRLAEILERRSSSGAPEARRVLDTRRRVVAESADALPRPYVARRAPIYDAGVQVAEVEVVRSVRPLLLVTGAVLAGALLVAILGFVVLRTLPLRALQDAYASLEASERRYRSLYAAMNEGLALYRVEQGAGGGVRLVLVDVNPACAQIVGLEGPGRTAGEVAAVLDPALAPLVPGLLSLEGTKETRTFELCLPGGRTLRAAVFAPMAGHLAALVADLTEHRRAEVAERKLQEQLLQAQRLESVGRLAAGVAHDFNNLLTVIISSAHALRDELGGEHAELAGEIAAAGERGAQLTRQLLAFGRRQVLCPEALAVGDVLATVGRMVRRLIGEDVELVVEGGDAGHVRMDPTVLEQAIVNLAVNARDAMPEGGRLTLRARAAKGAVPAAGRPGGPYVALAVSDTGAGMDAATLERAFDPFFTTKPVGKGTGLGLAMVRGVVEQSGGWVEAESRPGAGTTITLYLPRIPAPQPAGAAAAEATASGRGERILLVDDEPTVRAAVRRVLVTAGYAVVEAGSGEEGLAAFGSAAGAFDLVLTDLVMPGMSGLALGQAILARRRVPVLYLSGYGDEVVAGAALAPGALLHKPVERHTFLRAVRAALAGSPYLALGRAAGAE